MPKTCVLTSTLAAAALAAAVIVAPAATAGPVAHAAKRCDKFATFSFDGNELPAAGDVLFSNVHAVKTGCGTAKKVGLRWAKNLESGTPTQRHCAPLSRKKNGPGKQANCKAAGYQCHVTAVGGSTPKRRGEVVECRRGARRVSWAATVWY
jgi:hypothetical protein